MSIAAVAARTNVVGGSLRKAARFPIIDPGYALRGSMGRMGGVLFRYLEALADNRGAALRVVVRRVADLHNRASIEVPGATVTSLWRIEPMRPGTS